MTNFFYTDARGTKRGPCDEQLLRDLVANGSITPATLLETEDGHKMPAKYLSNLMFRSTVSMPWQFNFASHLLICQVCCIIVWVAAIALGGTVSYRGLQAIGDAKNLPANAHFYAIIVIVGTWGCCALCVAFTHLICAWSLITSKAAQLYVENCEKK